MIGYVELAVAVVLAVIPPLLVLASIWGKHSESVKAAHAKDIAQDLAIEKLSDRMIDREDKMYSHIENKISKVEVKIDNLSKTLNQKLDSIVLKLGA